MFFLCILTCARSNKAVLRCFSVRLSVHPVPTSESRTEAHPTSNTNTTRRGYKGHARFGAVKSKFKVRRAS